MSERAFVCAAVDGVLRKLRGREVVLRAAEAADVPGMHEVAERHGVSLRRVVLRTDVPLAVTDVSRAWQGVPVTLYAPSLGRPRVVLRGMSLLRQLDLQVFLPPHRSDNLRGLRMLSSLGVRCGVDLTDGPVLWDELEDLMTYALLGLAPRAPMSPFHEIEARYDPRRPSAFGDVYFDDPTRYLHVDERGGVALSAEDLRRGELVAQSVEDLGDLEGDPRYLRHVERWREAFLSFGGCACCPAFRVCLGRLRGLDEDDAGCRAFASAMLEVIDRRRNRAATRPACRP